MCLVGLTLDMKWLPTDVRAMLNCTEPKPPFDTPGDEISVITRLMEMPETCQAPVVVMTGSPDLSLRVKAEELGVAAYLEKPVDPERLLSVIEAASARRSRKPAHQ